MSIYTSIVQVRHEFLEEVRQFLQSMEGVDIHETENLSPELLITIDADDKEAEELSKRIQEHEGVITILHHSIHFEDE